MLSRSPVQPTATGSTYWSHISSAKASVLRRRRIVKQAAAKLPDQLAPWAQSQQLPGSESERPERKVPEEGLPGWDTAERREPPGPAVPLEPHGHDRDWIVKLNHQMTGRDRNGILALVHQQARSQWRRNSSISSQSPLVPRTKPLSASRRESQAWVPLHCGHDLPPRYKEPWSQTMAVNPHEYSPR